MNNDAVNTFVQVLAWTYVLISLGYMPRRGIPGLVVINIHGTLITAVNSYFVSG